MIYITAYASPDLDGYSCAFAYSELLNKLGKQVEGIIFGEPDIETKFVLNKFKISQLKKTPENIENDNFILVDASQIIGLSEKIKPDNVIEIIDHRKFNESEKFINAKIQIELIGAAATLVAEKFYENKINPTFESAILLYSAIVSNTINFKNKVTTERDIKMAAYLQQFFVISKNYVHEMFVNKSKLNVSLKEFFLSNLAKIEMCGKMVSILQLEIVEVDTFVIEHFEEIILLLNEIKEKTKVDYLFLTLVDIEKGFNIFICVDENTKKLIENSLKITFKNNLAKREGIIMRKEIIPKVKDQLTEVN
ncbi:MAG: DHH family phosphoesterase [archaeon]|jgi:manganese-dependent inorganic pyrophosphatase